MKIKYGQLGSLKDILNDIKDKDLSMQMAIDITRFITDSFNKESTLYEDKRVSTCLKYAKKDEQGNPISVDNQYQFEAENQVLFLKELNNLVEVEVDLTLPFKSAQELGDIKIKPNTLMLMKELKIID